VDELQILLKAIIDGDSVTSLDSQLSNIVKSLSASHEVKLKVAVDETSIRTTQSQLQSIAKQVSSAGNSGRQVQLKVFDAAQLQADGQRYFTGVRDIVSRVQKQFSKLGSVDVVNVFKDAQGDIQSFTASVTKADGVVERFNFNLSKIRHGSRTYSGFVQENSILSDKNAGTNLQKTLDYLNRIDNKIADITSRTLSNTAKPLLADMEQYNQYQTKLTQVKSRIDELRKANTTLSADHKREINSMVADLQRYARELQTSAYAATDLNAATFTNKKAELQAALQTDIQRWQNSGLFGADFKAAVNDAKRMLDEALDPTDLDAYRHQLSLLNQQFKQMKLQNTASGKILDADRLTSNIQTAQLRIQNLKNTYSSFVNDPNLLAKWQQLFDESKMISSSKELTNLNAKIRLFEQELISAGKHSRSLWDDLKANAAKMGSWMVLGGVIAGVMRGVTGLYDAVVQLDSAMTELMKVTDETDASYEAFLSDAADKAVQIGTTYADFVDSTASFARLGYNMEDASQLSEVANIYAVVGDEVDGIEGATNSIISTMKAFGIEVDDTMSIVDKFNEVGNRFAISSGGIGEAMMRSASAMAEANNTIDESIALIVAANNVIQDPDVVGTMWKTVSMRIRGAKTELEEAGLETEYMAETTASLRKKILGLTNVDGGGGFDIMLDEETFKSTYDIMLGISEVWEDMSDIDQAALLELLAGKRQGNALAAAITNMGDAVKVMDTSLNAEGSAVREHEKWMDSIQAKQQQFQAQYEVFANTILSSDLIKGVFDAGTGLLGWLTTLVDTVGALPAVFATVMPFLDKLNLFRTTDQKNWGGSGTGIAFAWNAQKLELDNDIKLLDEYNSKIANLGTSTGDLTQRQIVWNDTIGKGSDRLRSAVKVSDDAAVSSKAYASSMEQASIKTTLMGVKSKAAAIGVQVLNTALNALIGLGIGLAINAIISGITSLVNKSKEAREAALEAGSAAVQSSTELYDLASSYLEMSYAVEAGTASQEDLMSIQDELVAYLETQGIAVQNLSGDYDIVDNVLEPFDEFIEYADDFDLWDRFDFTKVDYLRQKIAALNRLLEQGVLTLREYTELLRETQLDIYNEQKDAITEIIEKTMELVRQEAEDKVDALEEQIDDYQKIIDLKKESLEVSRDEEDYEREVAERVAEIAKVQEKINQLSRDDSREANAERQQLEQELAELQQDLADYQADYAYDAQVDALDKEAEKFEQTKDDEIAKVEATVDTEEEVYNAAIARIDADWDQLYQDLIEWNRQYGDMIDGEDSITSAWQTAMQAAQEYGSIVSALNGINNDIANEQQAILDQQQEDAELSSILSEMYANGQAWGSASDEEKQRLADENLRLGKLLAPYGINAVRGSDGVWYVDRVGGEQLFQKYRQYIYHDGGIVGDDSLKSNEVFAKLQKGEAVFTGQQYENLLGQIGSAITGVVDSVVRSLATARDTTSDAIQSVINNESADNSMGAISIENHFEVKNADTQSAKELAEYYSDRTIDKLMTAAKRKGMKNSLGSHMLR
jgi:TP901 family phage tail tape measure protein